MKKITVVSLLAMLMSVLVNTQAAVQSALGPTSRDQLFEVIRNKLIEQIEDDNQNASLALVDQLHAIGDKNMPEKFEDWYKVLNKAVYKNNLPVVVQILRKTHMPLTGLYERPRDGGWNILSDAVAGKKFDIAKKMLNYLKKALKAKNKPKWLDRIRSDLAILSIFSGDFDDNRETPLMHAVKGNSEEAVSRIIDTLFSDEVLKVFGRFALFGQNPKKMAEEVAKGVVNAKNKQRQTALHLAVLSEQPNLSILDTLITYGSANEAHRDSEGHTPSDLVRQKLDDLEKKRSFGYRYHSAWRPGITPGDYSKVQGEREKVREAWKEVLRWFEDAEWEGAEPEQTLQPMEDDLELGDYPESTLTIDGPEEEMEIDDPEQKEPPLKRQRRN